MIAETDEQVKAYSIFSHTQEKFIEDAIREVQSIFTYHGGLDIHVAKFRCEDSRCVGCEKEYNHHLMYNGYEKISLDDVRFQPSGRFSWRDTSKLKKFFQEILNKTIEEGQLNPKSHCLKFECLYP